MSKTMEFDRQSLVGLVGGEKDNIGFLTSMWEKRSNCRFISTLNRFKRACEEIFQIDYKCFDDACHVDSIASGKWERTPRNIMDAIRRAATSVDPNLFCTLLTSDINAMGQLKPIVVQDIMHIDDARLVQSLGGVLIRIGTKSESIHITTDFVLTRARDIQKYRNVANELYDKASNKSYRIRNKIR